MSDDSNPEENDDELPRPGGEGTHDRAAQAPDPGGGGGGAEGQGSAHSYEDLAGYSGIDASEIASYVEDAKRKLERDFFDAVYRGINGSGGGGGAGGDASHHATRALTAQDIFNALAAMRANTSRGVNNLNAAGMHHRHLYVASGFGFYSNMAPQFGGAGGRAHVYGGGFAPQHPVKRNLPKEIIAGEITAWRVWRWDGTSLVSTAVGAIWKPGEPMRGEPDHGYGVHCWKTRKEALEYGLTTDGGSHRLVLGTISIWGKAISCENGYRASHAEITGIVSFIGRSKFGDGTRLERIRQMYGVPFNPLTDDVPQDLPDPPAHDPTGPHVHPDYNWNPQCPTPTPPPPRWWEQWLPLSFWPRVP